MILVSACLAGIKCRFDAEDRLDARIKMLVDNKAAISVCPEVLGGRKIPREPVEITGGDASGVIDGRAQVKDREGVDHTSAVLTGVNRVLDVIKKNNITIAVLKTKSPTCGCGQVFDGTFSGTLKAGNGVLAEALIREGVRVMTEKTFKM
jgi:uncharacterized protein YbbK (DUF523 family)